MITVDELRKQRNSFNKIYLEKVSEVIQNYDREGQRYVIVDIPFTVDVTQAKRVLQEAGYVVKYKSGDEGMRDGKWQQGKWQHFHISWEEL